MKSLSGAVALSRKASSRDLRGRRGAGRPGEADRTVKRRSRFPVEQGEPGGEVHGFRPVELLHVREGVVVLLLVRARTAVLQHDHVVAPAPGSHDRVLHAGVRPGPGHHAGLDVELAEDRVHAGVVEPVVHLLGHDEVPGLVVLEILHDQGFFGADDGVGTGQLEVPVDGDLGLLEAVVGEDDRNALLPRLPADLLRVGEQRRHAHGHGQPRLGDEEVGEHVHYQQRRPRHGRVPPCPVRHERPDLPLGSKRRERSRGAGGPQGLPDNRTAAQQGPWVVHQLQTDALP